MFRERQLKLLINESINRFLNNESKLRSSLRPEAPTWIYRQQISSHLLSGEEALEASEDESKHMYAK